MELILLPLLLVGGLLATMGGDDDAERPADQDDRIDASGNARVFGGEGDDLLTLDDQAQGLGGEGMTRLRRAMRPWAMGWRATTA